MIRIIPEETLGKANFLQSRQVIIPPRALKTREVAIHLAHYAVTELDEHGIKINKPLSMEQVFTTALLARELKKAGSKINGLDTDGIRTMAASAGLAVDTRSQPENAFAAYAHLMGFSGEPAPLNDSAARKKALSKKN